LSAAEAVSAQSAAAKPEVDALALPEDQGAAGLSQAIRRLSTRASLIAVVAHPDDEDGGLLAYESRGRGVRAALLTLTRGEGGQNALGAPISAVIACPSSRDAHPLKLSALHGRPPRHSQNIKSP
jgi:hypothetical protein